MPASDFGWRGKYMSGEWEELLVDEEVVAEGLRRWVVSWSALLFALL